MLIDAKEMGLETELKSLKKWFIESYCQGKERKDLKTTIKACKTYPMLYMQFEENGETKHMILREITALSKKIREHPDIISTCLARLYSKVDHKYL